MNILLQYKKNIFFIFIFFMFIFGYGKFTSRNNFFLPIARDCFFTAVLKIMYDNEERRYERFLGSALYGDNTITANIYKSRSRENIIKTGKYNQKVIVLYPNVVEDHLTWIYYGEDSYLDFYREFPYYWRSKNSFLYGKHVASACQFQDKKFSNKIDYYP